MQLRQIDTYRWEIPMAGAMRVPGIVYASADMLKGSDQKEPLKQVANVATLPGILKASLAMPDMHWGYGFPIGGVAAFDEEEGIVSPGGVGYDINCGVRIYGSHMKREDLSRQKENLVQALFRAIPSGVGSKRKDMRVEDDFLELVCLAPDGFFAFALFPCNCREMSLFNQFRFGVSVVDIRVAGVHDRTLPG